MFTSPQFKRRGRRKSCENSARTGGHAKSRLHGLEQLSRPLIPKHVLPASRRASTSWAVWETKQVTEGKAVPLRTHSFKRSLTGQPGQKRVPSLPSLRESHCPSETGGGVPAPGATLKCPKTQVTSVHKVADQSTNQSSSQACPWATSEARDPVRLCEHRGRPARGGGGPRGHSSPCLCFLTTSKALPCPAEAAQPGMGGRAHRCVALGARQAARSSQKRRLWVGRPHTGHTEPHSALRVPVQSGHSGQSPPGQLQENATPLSTRAEG